MQTEKNSFDAEKLHRQHVDEAIREARIRAELLDRMRAEHRDLFMRESCAKKVDTLRTLCDEVERLRGLIEGGERA